MAIGSSTSGIQSAAQTGWQQLKLQQAKRNADQAEQTARSLLTQAQDAQRTADREQETARTLSVQSDQALSVAGRARQGLAALSSLSQMQAQLTHVADLVIQNQRNAQASSPPQTSATASATPVVNTQGQLTGTVVNTTA